MSKGFILFILLLKSSISYFLFLRLPRQDKLNREWTISLSTFSGFVEKNVLQFLGLEI